MSLSDGVNPMAGIAERAAIIRRERLGELHHSTDRVFCVLLLLQWAGGMTAALVLSPRTWIGASSQVHVHVWMATVLGGLLTLFPVFLAVRRPGAALTRHVIAAAQVLWSALLIHLTGGRIETHFHVFGSLAFLAFYRDWRVLVTASAFVAVDHAVRGTWWPQSVFGATTGSDWRWLEHAGWVVFEDVFLVASCVRGQREITQIAQRQAELEGSFERTEREVERRTNELREANARAEAASRSKSEFLANMSHEIRTPLTSILGYADVLREDGDVRRAPKGRLDSIDTIRGAGRHLLAIINDILDLSKIEAGRMTIERIETDLPSLLGEIESLIRPRAAGKGVEFGLGLVTPIPQRVMTDPTRLRQILMNLAGNAVKFTEQGRVTISANFSECGGAHRLIVEVEDTGVGMTAEQAERVFSPFTQADGSVSRRHGGTGLGLSICRRLADLMGGGVTIERTEPGKGTCLRLMVPMESVSGTAMVGCHRSPRAEAEVQGVQRARLNGKVLLAEDGPDNQRLIVFLLKRAGAQVDVADDGAKALEMIELAEVAGTPYAMLLTDIQMPEMDGYTLARTLRKRGNTIPIVALTAHAMTEVRNDCSAAGCDGYATKPIDEAALLAMCAEWIGRRSEAVASKIMPFRS